MADTIRRRLERADQELDDRLEPATDCARRALARATLRRALEDDEPCFRALGEMLGMAAQTLGCLAASRPFGEAWELLEQSSVRLRRRLVPVSMLQAQVRAAGAILDFLDQAQSTVSIEAHDVARSAAGFGSPMEA
ncbi:hypothetical protein [Acidisphaera sp. L21]|uniref:hypothetical protein n=1 Tax=Acidisphaera sp. L21 TaxID=1641851 RepID=UPI0020B170BD|nr:hypothetical protein [Acidisphaera sp. L21]